jgi:hypothetical protein
MSDSLSFVPGAKFCQAFYMDAVLPALASEPAHAAALLDGGSEGMGFDTPMSMDHDWGPRVQLFFESAPEGLAPRLGQSLPKKYRGLPVAIEAEGRLKVEVTTWAAFKEGYLGLRGEPDAADWLGVPQQKLRTVATGPIFHDGIGLEAARSVFAWYPRDLWLYLLACTWQRIGQEEHLVGRAGFVGDEIGAKLIAARLTRDAMRLAFLLERQYAPYPKWFGTAFGQLKAAGRLKGGLEQVLAANGWEARDAALGGIYRVLADLQNESGVIPARAAKVGRFFSRPFSAIELHAEFSDALVAEIEDPTVKAIAARTRAGSIDQISDNTDLLEDANAQLRQIWTSSP